MIYSRVAYNGEIYYAAAEGEELSLLLEAPYKRLVGSGKKVHWSEVRLLAPCQPTKIVCVGLNYADHARELGIQALPKEPLIFLKPSTAVIGPEEAIVYPPCSERVDYEAELAVVVKEAAARVSVKDARSKIWGYTCGNDVTARDLQQRDGQWTRSKSFDTFCPLGPWIVEELNPQELNIRLLVNGEERQNSNTREMIFSVEYLVSYISHIMTLLPGDVIMTGTPPGVGPVRPGDVVTVEIQGIGSLVNKVITSNF